MKNKKGQMDFDEISIVGILFGLIGGMISVIITKRMGGGGILSIIGFVIAAVVCYFVGNAVSDS